jgi:hypothetical protein
MNISRGIPITGVGIQPMILNLPNIYYRSLVIYSDLVYLYYIGEFSFRHVLSRRASGFFIFLREEEVPRLKSICCSRTRAI